MLHHEVLGTVDDPADPGRLILLQRQADAVLSKHSQMQKTVKQQEILRKEKNIPMLDISQDDLDIILELVNLPNLINQIINQE